MARWRFELAKRGDRESYGEVLADTPKRRRSTKKKAKRRVKPKPKE